MTSSRLYVGNLPYSATSDDVNKLFATHGTVKEVKIIESKGFGFVEMSTANEAEAARNALNGNDYNGRQLRIDEAKPQTPRTNTGYSRNNRY